MKHTFFISAAIILSAFMACNNPANTGGNATSKTDSSAVVSKTDRNKKTIMAGMEGLNAHDLNKVFKDIAANFLDYQDGSMPPQKGDSAKESLRIFTAAFPDMKAENQVYCAEGDNVMVLSDWTMTFKNDMGSLKATGKTAKFKDVDIFTFDDNGKITSHRSIYPNSAMLAQVGVDMAKMQAMMDKDAKKAVEKKK